MLTQPSSSNPMRRKPQQARSQERVNHILGIADQVFAEMGFEATTMVEIAARAQTSIGSLYRFFPDKIAILKALADSYLHQLQQVIAEIHTPEAIHLPLAEYVDRTVWALDQFFLSHPGYRSIFVQSRGASSEVLEMKADVDRQIAGKLATFYAQRNIQLQQPDLELISLVIVEAVSSLQSLSLSRDEAFRLRVVSEMRKLMLSYLQIYTTE